MYPAAVRVEIWAFLRLRSRVRRTGRGGALPRPPFSDKGPAKIQTRTKFFWGFWGGVDENPRIGPRCSICGRLRFRPGNLPTAGRSREIRPFLRFAEFAQWSAGACALCVRVRNPDNPDTQRAPACIMRARWNPSGVGDQSPPRFAYSEFSEMNRRGAGDPAQNRPCNALYGRFCVQKSPFPLIFDEMPGKRGNL